MGTVMDGKFMSFLVELEAAATALIDKYYDESLEDDTNPFQYYAPITVKVYTVNGLTAQFLEEGIELYPADRHKEQAAALADKSLAQEKRIAELTDELRRAVLTPGAWKAGDPCGKCGSTATAYDVTDGASCYNCGATDADE